MNALLVILVLVVLGGVVFMVPIQGPGAVVVCLVVSVPTILLLARAGPEKRFLLRLFVIGLLIRLVVGTVIYVGHLEEFFGGDANTYDYFGAALAQSWHGDAFQASLYEGFVSTGAGAWGMLYVVAIIYETIGRNMLAVQFVNASVGSATAVVIYYVAQHLFNNSRVSRISAVLACFFPSLILWSSQALKDALIVLVLAIAIYATLQLMDRITVPYVVVLTACLLSLLSLRFYIFYMMVAAVVGAFILGMKTLNAQSFVSRFLAIAAIGLTFTWFGVIRFAGTQLETFGNLETIQQSRQDAATTADSGFGKDVDVRTTEGALSIIPIGILYLMFAPFPWQLASLRQSIALPEMTVWWLCFPLLVLGIWYAVKHRLRKVSPILLFTTMLTLAYSLFQGNVGTAYRQRSQLLVFYFIFVGVGAVLMLEKAEERRRRADLERQEQAARIAGGPRDRRKPLDSQTPQAAQ